MDKMRLRRLVCAGNARGIRVFGQLRADFIMRSMMTTDAGLSRKGEGNIRRELMELMELIELTELIDRCKKSINCRKARGPCGKTGPFLN
jgi:hypothetical protein